MATLDSTQLLPILESLIFVSAVFTHLIKRNKTLVNMYSLQSLGLIMLLTGIGIAEHVNELLFAAGLMLIAKVILAPIIFLRVIKQYDERIPTSAYLSTPLTLIAILALVVFAYSGVFNPLVALAPQSEQVVRLSLASIFVSLLLTMNRKGIVHQIIGVLSMENGIVALASILGLEHTFAIELGIIFDVLMWTVGASVFIALIHQHFGTLDTSAIKNLRE